MTIHTTPPGLDVTQIHWQHRERLPMWTIYDHPSDYPEGYVARMFLSLPGEDRREATGPTGYAVFGSTLEEVREAMPYGTFAFARYPGDEPHIVEVWL